jgi:hypothetical protein
LPEGYHLSKDIVIVGKQWKLGFRGARGGDFFESQFLRLGMLIWFPFFVDFSLLGLRVYVLSGVQGM